MVACATVWNAVGGDAAKYEPLVRSVMTKLHEEFPHEFPADMPPPSRQEILRRLLKR